MGLHPTGVPLLPKLRGHFAEFLNEGSPVHLGLLDLSTCVGLRYGQTAPGTHGFSWQFGLNPLGVGSPHLTITPHPKATRLDGSRRWAYPPASPWHSSRSRSGTGMLTGCPSPTARALGLGPTHPQLMTIAAEPCDIRWEGFAPSSRYSYRHSHSSPLQVGFRLPFTAATTLPYHMKHKLHIHGVGGGLSPGTLSAPGHTRPVSYYALFQGWLLLSQPPGCLRARTSLSTESTLRDLSRWSGLFPSRRRILAPAVSLLWPTSRHSEFGSSW